MHGILNFWSFIQDIASQDITDELDLKIKKYTRGEGAYLEVWIIDVLQNKSLLIENAKVIVNFDLQALQDKKLKGQLAVREELYKKSANAAAKAEKVSYCCVWLCDFLNRLIFCDWKFCC